MNSVNVVVEIHKGSRSEYAMEFQARQIRLDGRSGRHAAWVSAREVGAGASDQGATRRVELFGTQETRGVQWREIKWR